MSAIIRIVEMLTAISVFVYLLMGLWALIRRKMAISKRLCLLAFVGLWSNLPAQATTLTVASCTGSSDHTKVQTQVNAAVDNDIVQIQAGNCTFGAPVTWSDKNITVQGAGQGVTNVTSNAGSAFAITPSTKAGFRITAMSISSTSNDPTIDIDAFNASSVIANKFRLDHLTMTQTQSVSGSPRTFSIQGLIYGLIDHVTATATATDPSGFDWTHTFVELNAQSTADNYPTNFAGHVAANLPVTLGDDNAIYVEDSSFTVNQYSVVNNITYGARMVMRHNTFTGPQHTQTHSTRGDERGGVRSEYYNNVFDCQNHANCPGSANMISGTGVMFNNTIKNNSLGQWQGTALVLGFQRCANTTCTVSLSPLLTCSTSSGYDGGIESNGWPCADQPGWHGTLQGQTNVPIYVWNNGSADGCSSGGSCAADYGVGINCNGEGNVGAHTEDYVKTTTHSNGAKDYCVGTTTMPSSCGTHTNTYSSYTYPHPLQGSNTGGSLVIFLELASVLSLAYHWRSALVTSALTVVQMSRAIGLSSLAVVGAVLRVLIEKRSYDESPVKSHITNQKERVRHGYRI